MKRIKREILNWAKERIELDALRNIIKSEDYLSLVNTIECLENEDCIKPVKSSGKNGKNPGLYLKYHIIREKDHDEDLIREIKGLHFWISSERFLKHPEKYLSCRTFIYTLSEFLKIHSDKLETALSENERAYQIWKDEKALDKKNGKDNIRLLKECGVFEKLNTYPTPEPFFDYRRGTDIHNVLVIENKDTWFTVRKLMLEDPCLNSLLGVEFDCIVYGEGNKVTQKINSLEDYLSIDQPFCGKVCYWGDLDLKGIDMYLSFKGISPRQNICPFIAAYELMIDRFDALLKNAENKEIFIGHNNQTAPENIEEFYLAFDEMYADRLAELFSKGYYIPQEILNYEVLKELAGQ